MELGLLGKFPEAAAEFEQVVRLRPDYAEGHLNLGIALARQGSMSEALAHLQTALRLEPGNGKAREFITRIEQLNAHRGAP
jgi:Flp pilus assembly protein TadD